MNFFILSSFVFAFTVLSVAGRKVTLYNNCFNLGDSGNVNVHGNQGYYDFDEFTLAPGETKVFPLKSDGYFACGFRRCDQTPCHGNFLITAKVFNSEPRTTFYYLNDWTPSVYSLSIQPDGDVDSECSGLVSSVPLPSGQIETFGRCTNFMERDFTATLCPA